MDKFVRSFIIAAIIYLGISSIIGITMLVDPSLLIYKFAHSHLMLLGWISMMIFGVGYHILPRFSGIPLKSKKVGEVQFWLANIGLIGMVLFYSFSMYNPETGAYKKLTIIFGLVEVLSILLFLYNMLATLLTKMEEQG